MSLAGGSIDALLFVASMAAGMGLHWLSGRPALAEHRQVRSPETPAREPLEPAGQPSSEPAGAR